MIDPIARKDQKLLVTKIQKLPNPVRSFYCTLPAKLQLICRVHTEPIINQMTETYLVGRH
jgi:hypothetical protein